MQQLSFPPIIKRDSWSLGVWFGMQVDDEMLVEARSQTVDPNILFDALLQDGTHEIINCECGEFGCGGSLVTAMSAPEGWLIEIGWNPSRVLLIPWVLLIDACQELIDSLHHIASQHATDPQLCGSWPLMPHVEQFEEVLRMLRANPGPNAFDDAQLVPVQTWRGIVFEWNRFKDTHMPTTLKRGSAGAPDVVGMRRTIERCVTRTRQGRLPTTAEEKSDLLGPYVQLVNAMPQLGIAERNYVSALSSIARGLLGPDAPPHQTRIVQPG